MEGRTAIFDELHTPNCCDAEDSLHVATFHLLHHKIYGRSFKKWELKVKGMRLPSKEPLTRPDMHRGHTKVRAGDRKCVSGQG